MSRASKPDELLWLTRTQTCKTRMLRDSSPSQNLCRPLHTKAPFSHPGTSRSRPLNVRGFRSAYFSADDVAENSRAYLPAPWHTSPSPSPRNSVNDPSRDPPSVVVSTRPNRDRADPSSHRGSEVPSG